MKYNLILNVPSSLAFGSYDEVEVPDGNKYHLVRNETTLVNEDPDSATMDSVVESGTFEVVKAQTMKIEMEYTSDPDALPEAVHKQLVSGKIRYAQNGPGRALNMPGTLVVSDRKLMHFVTALSLVKVNNFITKHSLDWTVECHQPFKYSRIESEDGSVIFDPKPSKGIKASRVVPFIPKRYAEYDENGDPIEPPLTPQKEWLHGFSGQSPWVLTNEL